MTTSLEIPIVLLVFNRPKLTAKVLAAIRAVRPRRFFVIADGPRPDRPGESQLVAEVRNAIELAIDWPCEVDRLYSEINLGCGRRVTSGLDEIFRRVESAIILEDDCLPDATFFPFCAEMLRRYCDDPKVGAISGDNFQHGRKTTSYSYYFSHYPHCWGWATWRHAWQRHDPTMAAWPQLRANSWLDRRFNHRKERKYWRDIFNATYACQIDTWAYRWTFTCWSNDWLTILPAENLISNIGFDAAGTHTRARSPSANLPIAPMRFPLAHPPNIVRDQIADTYTFRHHFAPPPIWRRIWRRIVTR